MFDTLMYNYFSLRTHVTLFSWYTLYVYQYWFCTVVSAGEDRTDAIARMFAYDVIENDEKKNNLKSFYRYLKRSQRILYHFILLQL